MARSMISLAKFTGTTAQKMESPTKSQWSSSELLWLSYRIARHLKQRVIASPRGSRFDFLNQNARSYDTRYGDDE